MVITTIASSLGGRHGCVVTVRLERAHAEFPSQDKGPLSPSHRRLTSKAPGAPLGHPRRMFSHLDPHVAEAYQCRAIHSECLNSRLANGSEVENNRRIGVPAEVLFPSLVLRVKQWHGMTEQGSDGCLTRGFTAITGRTG